MYTFIRQKIVKLTDRVSDFVRQNLVEVIIVVGAFVFLEVIKSFPYINIIPNYQFLVIGFTILLSVVLLRVSISDKNIIFAVLILFLLAAITAIFDIKRILDLIGFIIFVLLTLVVIRQIINDRESLKKIDSNN